MKYFNQSKFNQLVLEYEVIGFKTDPIKLKSGRDSHWYVNWRSGTSDVHLLRELAKYITAYTKDQALTPDQFYGVPEGATALGIVANIELAEESTSYARGSHSIFLERKEPKSHGEPKDRFFVGQPHGKIIVLEDVTTTGGSLIKTIKRLQDYGLEIIAAYGLTNRNEKNENGKSVEEAVGELGVPYFALSNALDLLPLAAQQSKPSTEILRHIEKEFQQYGEKKLHFPE